MFKLIVLSNFIAASFAIPSYFEPGVSFSKSTHLHEPGTVVFREHTIESVDEHVQTVPISSSGQSRTILQKHLSHEPSSVVGTSTIIKSSYDTPDAVIKHYNTPTVIKSYDSPILEILNSDYLVPDVKTVVIQSEVPTVVKTIVVHQDVPTVLLDQHSTIPKKHISHILPTIDSAPTVVKSYGASTVT